MARRHAAAFTLIELLIVIVVIGVLIGAILLFAGRFSRQQKVNATRQVMRNLTMAIEEFSKQDPLASVYDSRARRTFGAYPPYQVLGDHNDGLAVAGALEPYVSKNPDDPPKTLQDRLWRDLAGRRGKLADVVVIDTSDTRNHDIRALYAYLKAFGGPLLAQVPAQFIKPLPYDPDKFANGEYVNAGDPKAGGGNLGRVPVLGIYDAWGVPLDYFLYVKLEYQPDERGNLAWRVTDRMPALRSRGATAEQIANGGDKRAEWIFSATLPTPEANGPYDSLSDAARLTFQKKGVLRDKNVERAGWARAVADDGLGGNEDNYGYLP